MKNAAVITFLFYAYRKVSHIVRMGVLWHCRRSMTNAAVIRTLYIEIHDILCFFPMQTLSLCLWRYCIAECSSYTYIEFPSNIKPSIKSI